jgi:hypothetical protein
MRNRPKKPDDLLALFGNRLDDGLFAAIITALWANPVVQHWRSAIGTGGKLRYFGLVVGSSLIPAGIGDFSFRVWHDSILDL